MLGIKRLEISIENKQAPLGLLSKHFNSYPLCLLSNNRNLIYDREAPYYYVEMNYTNLPVESQIEDFFSKL